jgi:hypothetical protein
VSGEELEYGPGTGGNRDDKFQQSKGFFLDSPSVVKCEFEPKPRIVPNPSIFLVWLCDVIIRFVMPMILYLPDVHISSSPVLQYEFAPLLHFTFSLAPSTMP